MIINSWLPHACSIYQIESVLHEMYHTIGGNHEVQRLDRSNYITVLWDNTKQYEFKQYVVDKVTRDRFPYDYHSVMQYRISVRQFFFPPSTLSLYINILSLSLSLSFKLNICNFVDAERFHKMYDLMTRYVVFFIFLDVSTLPRTKYFKAKRSWTWLLGNKTKNRIFVHWYCRNKWCISMHRFVSLFQKCNTFHA